MVDLLLRVAHQYTAVEEVEVDAALPSAAMVEEAADLASATETTATDTAREVTPELVVHHQPEDREAHVQKAEAPAARLLGDEIAALRGADVAEGADAVKAIRAIVAEAGVAAAVDVARVCIELLQYPKNPIRIHPSTPLAISDEHSPKALHMDE